MCTDFHNAFFVQHSQGANLISNIPHNLTEAGRTIAVMIQHALGCGHREIEVTSDAQDAWVALLLKGMGRRAWLARLHRLATTTTRGRTRGRRRG